MKVRFVPKNEIPADPVNRMRCFDVIAGLKARGIDVGLYQGEADMDVLVILSLDFDRWLPVVRELRAAGVKVVFDLSDNEFRRRAKLNRGRILRTLPHLWNPREMASRLLYFRHRQKFDVKIDAFVPQCDMVTCSSQGIYDDAARLARARRLIPDVIDVDLYCESKVHTAAGADAKIVWVGMASNLVFLDPAGPALRKLQRCYGMDVRVITDPDAPKCRKQIAKMLRCECTLVRWTLETVVEELLACDVGIAPYSGPLSKSANKVATYWAIGLPAVASPLEDYLPIVRNGENGYIARTDAEWYQAIEKLLHDPALRQRQGQAGRQVVHERYAPQAVCGMWQEALDAVAAARA